MLQGCKRLHGLTIGALGRKRIESVGCGEDSGAEGNGFARQAEGITGTVPVLVVVLDVLERLLDMKEGRKNVEPDPHVLLDVLVLLRREPVGLVQNCLANSNLANVVETARHAQIFTDG